MSEDDGDDAIVDGTLLPCWSRASHPELHSGKHKTTGLGFEREVELVEAARERELVTLAYVHSEAEATAMTQAGADVLVPHLGLTTSGMIGAQKTPGTCCRRSTASSASSAPARWNAYPPRSPWSITCAGSTNIAG